MLSYPVVIVGEAHDIIFLHIVTVLNFDDLKGNIFGVLETVFGIDGNESAFSGFSGLSGLSSFSSLSSLFGFFGLFGQ